MSETGTYWDNEGKYQEQYNKAFAKFVPCHGKAEDGWPEALRAISRIGYDYYNNGFANLWQEWEEYDCDGSYRDYEMDSYYEDLVDYLAYQIPRDLHNELKDFIYDAKGYSNWSKADGVIDRVINHIIEGIIEDGLLEEELVD